MNLFTEDKGVIYKISPNVNLNIYGELRLENEHENFMMSNHSYVRMDEDSELWVNGIFTIYSPVDCVIYQNGILRLGNNSFINSGSEIRCKKYI